MEAGRRTNGLRGEYYANRDFRGDPLFVRVDKKVDFRWWDDSPHPGLESRDYSIRWTGLLLPPRSGVYDLGAEGFNAFRVYLEDKLLVEYDGSHEAGKASKGVELRGGTPYRIRVDFFVRSGDASIKLLWHPPAPDLRKEALEAASRADAVILCLGLSPRLEGEEMDVPVEGFAGGDRLTLDLPAVQEDLLEAVMGLGKPTVLVLLNGSPLAVNGADERVPAILEAWYPGQAGGHAIADVVFGDANPGGRLPVTFYRSVNDLPPFQDYAMKGRTYRYFEGTPLYPFGYGLSYTRFEYSGLKVPAKIAADEPLSISVDVRNAGARAGEEVVQLYIRDKAASVPVPLRSLQGFHRILLNPGESRRVTFALEPGQLSVLNKDFRRIVEPGWFEIAVGGIQPGFQGKPERLTTQVLTAEIEVLDQVRKDVP